MNGSYVKRFVCLSCRQKFLSDESEANAHQQLGHHIYQSYFGGYQKERREPLISVEIGKEEKIKHDLLEEYEDFEQAEEIESNG